MDSVYGRLHVGDLLAKRFAKESRLAQTCLSRCCPEAPSKGFWKLLGGNGPNWAAMSLLISGGEQQNDGLFCLAVKMGP